MAHPTHLSLPLSYPTTRMTPPLLQTLAPEVSSLQSQGEGKEIRLFSFHCNFQSVSAAHVHVLFCIPTTLIGNSSKFPQISPVPLDFDPSFSSKVGSSTLLTATLDGKSLYRPSSLRNISLVPWDLLSASTVGWGGSTAVKKMGKTWRKKKNKSMIFLSCLMRLE